MIRGVLSFAAAASLLLCVVTAGLWVRSYFVADAFYNRRITTQPQNIRRCSVDGDALRGRFEVRLEYLHFWPRPAQPIPIGPATASPRELSAIRRRAYLQNWQAAAVFQRMSVEISQTPPPYWYSMSANAVTTTVEAGRPKLNWSSNRSEDDIAWTASLNAPHWLVVALTAIFAASFWWLRGRCRRKFGRNGCPACGYNLTGNTSGVCPECGTPVPRKAETAT
jgi:hypothetical protein